MTAFTYKKGYKEIRKWATMLRVTACSSSRYIGPNSVCRPLAQRREKLIKILDEQEKIAKKLSKQSDPTFSKEARHAWEIVEELSQKLNKMTVQLDECLVEERIYWDKLNTDEDLSQREYDM
jgi:hypothetical protein